MVEETRVNDEEEEEYTQGEKGERRNVTDKNHDRRLHERVQPLSSASSTRKVKTRETHSCPRGRAATVCSSHFFFSVCVTVFDKRTSPRLPERRIPMTLARRSS